MGVLASAIIRKMSGSLQASNLNGKIKKISAKDLHISKPTWWLESRYVHNQFRVPAPPAGILFLAHPPSRPPSRPIRRLSPSSFSPKPSQPSLAASISRLLIGTAPGSNRILAHCAFSTTTWWPPAPVLAPTLTATPKSSPTSSPGPSHMPTPLEIKKVWAREACNSCLPVPGSYTAR